MMLTWDELVSRELGRNPPRRAIEEIRTLWHYCVKNGVPVPWSEERMEEYLHAVAEFHDLHREVEQ